jgi:hypothetical protein
MEKATENLELVSLLLVCLIWRDPQSFIVMGSGLSTYCNFPGITFFKLSGAWLMLFPRDELALDAQVSSSGQGFSGITLAHNVDSKAEADVVLKEAEKAGVRITKPAQDTDWGGYSGYYSDPNGCLWEVAWNPHFDLS